MELWSRGLGTKTVNLRLGEAEVEDCDSHMVIKGKMGPPVWWDYKITMTADDLDDILHVAAQRGTISYLLGSKKRMSLLFTGVKQVLKIVLSIGVGLLRRTGRRSTQRGKIESGKNVEEAG